MSEVQQANVTRLEEIVGTSHVLTNSAELSSRQVDGLNPAAVVRPADAAQIAEIVRFAAAEKLSFVPCSGCTKLSIGSPLARYDFALDLRRMNRVLSYDPRDLTLGVEPGVRVEELLKVLAEQNQFLPLAVSYSDRASIGGIVATNSSSPLRHGYGGIRDFCLGMEFVTGDGVAAKSGGRVVKNVTGYDLHKLLIGSLGTLAVITRVNFRTFPLPATYGTFVATFSDAEAAFGFSRAIAHSVLIPQIVEVADPGAARLLFSDDDSPRIDSQQWCVIVSAAGQAAVVDRHARELGHLATAAKSYEFLRLTDPQHSSIVSRLREFPRLILEAEPSGAIFRFGVIPTAMPSLAKRLSHLASQNYFAFAALTRASGVMYAAFVSQRDNESRVTTQAKLCKEIFASCSDPEINAQAILEWCPTEVKRSVGGVWGPERQDFGLMRRVKNAFDPHCVLSPGRFAGGI